jgi:hypothetical protein
VRNALTSNGVVVDTVIALVQELHDLISGEDNERVTAELWQNKDSLLLGVLLARMSGNIHLDHLKCRVRDKPSHNPP